MKQYKFRCPLCGKWHDIILWDFNYWGAICDSNKEDSFKPFCFEVSLRPLPALLSVLKRLNIEVVETCDKLRWKFLKESVEFCDRYETQSVLTKQGASVYTIIPYDGEYFELLCNDKPMNGRKSPQTTTTLTAAKGACQDDFEKRRAK